MSGANASISDEDRKNLAQKLDDDLNNYIDNLPKQKYKDGWTEENWEKEFEKHPLLMTKALKEGDDLPPLMQALQQLKYDPNENTSEELAANYKTDGNENFKLKKYRWAIDAYTEGIKLKCSDDLMNAQLHTNRAAAHFHLGNYRSSLNDAEQAIKFKDDHEKAINRAIICCMKMGRYKDAIQWCDRALKIKPNDGQHENTKKEATTQMKLQERDKRKRRLKNSKNQVNDEAILKAIMNKGIRLESDDSSADDEISPLESLHPAIGEHRVHFNTDGKHLVWPVIFVYPEYGQTDFISHFHESSRFIDHLDVMFADKPGWDTDKKYIPSNIELYCEDANKQIFQIKSSATLENVLTQSGLVVYGGVPTFLLMVKGSKFAQSFNASAPTTM